MKIVTWNVNSLKAREAFFLSFLDKEEPDIICLQELKQQTDAVKVELFESRGYHVVVHGQKQWNGVLIASKFPIEDTVLGLAEAEEGQSRFIAATINDFRLVNLYCPQGQNEDSDKYAYKLRFYDALIAWCKKEMTLGLPIIMTGDFNIAPEPCDVFWDTDDEPNIVTHHPLELESWAELISLGLTDVGRPFIPEGGFTFWDYRGFWDFEARRFRYDRGMRIDHFLVTQELESRVDGVSVYRGWRRNKGKVKASDHAPVLLELSPSKNAL